MKVSLICAGKISDAYIREGVNLFSERVKKCCKFDVLELIAGKGDETTLKKQEGDLMLKKISDAAFVVLLDENGQEKTSVEFANFIRHHQNISTKNLIFVIGGAYGFSEKIYQRANTKLSFSKMTFPHQLMRLIFLEQLYRSFTILKGEKYHH